MTSLDTRAADRDSMFLMADIFADAGQPAQRVKVRNLSAGGMMVEGDLRLKRGARIAARSVSTTTSASPTRSATAGSASTVTSQIPPSGR